MEEKLMILRKQIKANFWISPDGDCIYSNMCTLHPKYFDFFRDLGLTVDTYINGGCACLRFFEYDDTV